MFSYFGSLDNKRMNRSRACGRISTSMYNRPDAVILDVMSLGSILMNENTYRPRDYSNPAFSRDSELQSLLIRDMRRLGGRVKIAFIAMLGVFVTSLVVAFAGLPVIVLIAIPVFAILLAYCIYHLIPRRQFICGNCSTKMSIQWEACRDGTDGRFATCETCQRYVDTLWTSR